MAEKTTISLTNERHGELESMKEHDRESFDSVIGRLLDENDERPTDAPDTHIEVDTDAVAREVARELDYAQIANVVADEVEDRMR